MTLLPISQAAPLLGCRDPRTAAKRLTALGVPVLELCGRRLVDDAEIHRAIRSHARPLDPAAPSRPAGVRLAPGEKAWDSPAEGQVGGRAALTADPRGSRVVQTQAASEAYVASATSSTSRHNDEED